MTLVLDPIEVPTVVPASTPITPKPTEPTTIADTLFQASTILEEGWISGVRRGFKDGRIVHCALGAIDKLFGNILSETVLGTPRNSVEFIANYLKTTGRIGDAEFIGASWNLAAWNNQSDQQTVVSTFREAAEAARKLGV